MTSVMAVRPIPTNQVPPPRAWMTAPARLATGSFASDPLLGPLDKTPEQDSCGDPYRRNQAVGESEEPAGDFDFVVSAIHTPTARAPTNAHHRPTIRPTMRPPPRRTTTTILE